MENIYFVIEHQVRKDGEVNTSETRRSSFASALSLYHERYSKMVMNEEFLKVSLMMVDQDLEVVEKATFETQAKKEPEIIETTVDEITE